MAGVNPEQDCIFCKIERGEIPAEKLFDDGEAFAIRDVSPKAPTHILVIPHAHVEALVDATDAQRAAAAHCLAVAPQIAAQEGIASRGYRIVANQGPESGQEVPHFHLHILGGRALGPMG
jgi:histidine triad (HIT) family protein